MQPIKITVNATRAACTERPDPITTGMVGLRAEFTFSADWDGLQKTAVCVGSGVTRDVLDVQDAITVPHECLTDPASELKIGVHGVNSSGDLVIPTVYAYCGRLFRGADPSGDESADPTLPIWAQLQAMMGSLDNLTTTAKENLVAAINEAAKTGGGGGGGTPADVKMQVAGGYIQYSTDGGATWTNLIAMADLIGQAGPAGADGQDGAPGADGQDGITPTIGPNGNWYLGSTDTGKPSRGETGPAGADGKNGADGQPGRDGVDGQDGVGIQSVEQTTTSTEDGGTNVVTVTRTDGTTSTFQVKNGSRGNTGPAGATGATPNIQIGTVETLEPGSNATATITGTPENPILNLGIPRGADGSGGGSGTITHGIIWNLTNVTSSNSAVSIGDGSALSAVLTADTGYTLGAVTVTMGGTDITATAWDAETSKVTIDSVTGDVIITCTGTAQSSGEVLDTSPVIAVNNAQTNRGEGTTTNAYTCVTQPYKVKEVSEQVTLVYCTPWDRWNSNLNAPTIQLYLGDTFVTYWSQIVGNDAADALVEHTLAINNNYGNCDSVRLTLWQNHIDNSYAYVKETGEILFAGANTQYYGMTNINGNTGGESAVSVAAEVDNQIAMLSLSTGETADTSAYSGLSSDYVAMVQANYDAMMAECLGDYNKIPLIVHTDQHGRIGASSQVMKLIGDMVNWYEVSKCINLGDTVTDRFGTSELENYLSATKDSIPLSKRLDVYGNHDVWDSDDSQKYIVDQKRLSPYFKNIYARRHGNNGYFTVVDDYYNVKYLVISDLEYPDTNDSTRRITTAQAKFIVSELSEDDGRDIVIVSHVPFDSDEVTSRDDTYAAYSEKFLHDTTAHNSFMAMLSARKNKTSGSFMDSEGVEHAYDFSGVSGDLLMSLHGHTHFEAYRTFENSITEFAFDWFDGNTFYFAYIDRQNKKFKAWKNETDVAALEISIA